MPAPNHSDAIILTIAGSTIASATASLISRLLGLKYRSLEPDEHSKTIRSFHRCILVLDCLGADNQVGGLVKLRLKGFDGPAILISFETFDQLKARYRVLRAGHGSHATCTWPLSLADLIAKVDHVVPLEPENLKMLQQEIEAPERFLNSRIFPRIVRLQRRERVFEEELDRLAAIVECLRSSTPAACHIVVEIMGRRAQIQEHLHYIFDLLRRDPAEPGSELNALRMVFEEWRKVVMFQTSEEVPT